MEVVHQDVGAESPPCHPYFAPAGRGPAPRYASVPPSFSIRAVSASIASMPKATALSEL